MNSMEAGQRFTAPSAGPTIELDFTQGIFSITFSHATDPIWLTNPQEVTPVGTMGSTNRAYLHRRLDDFLSSYVHLGKLYKDGDHGRT